MESQSMLPVRGPRNTLNALIVESDRNMRGKLKQTLHGSTDYHRVLATNELRDGVNMLARPKLRLDVVFISHQFGDDYVESFIKQSRETSLGATCAYIVVFRGDQSDQASLANSLLRGADSFLIAPFSAASVSETAVIGFAVRRKHADQRLSAASGMILDSMLAEVDRRAAQKAEGRKPSPIKGSLQEAARQFREVAGDSMQKFFDAALDRFSSVELEEEKQKGYDGPSERVKKMYSSDGEKS